MRKFVSKIGDTASLLSGIIPSILLWIFQPDKPVPYSVLAIAIIFLWVSVWITLRLYYENKDIKSKMEKKELRIFNCINHNTILCYPLSDVAISSIVTLFKLENNYEKLLAYGNIRNIQNNGFVEIEIIRTFNHSLENDTFMNYINSNANNIVIKNVATMDALYSINQENDRRQTNE